MKYRQESNFVEAPLKPANDNYSPINQAMKLLETGNVLNKADHSSPNMPGLIGVYLFWIAAFTFFVLKLFH